MSEKICVDQKYELQIDLRISKSENELMAKIWDKEARQDILRDVVMTDGVKETEWWPRSKRHRQGRLRGSRWMRIAQDRGAWHKLRVGEVGLWMMMM